MFWPFSKSYQERKLERDSYVQEKEKHNQVLQMRIDKCKHKVDAGKKIVVKKAPMVRKKTANKSTQVALLTDKSNKIENQSKTASTYFSKLNYCYVNTLFLRPCHVCQDPVCQDHVMFVKTILRLSGPCHVCQKYASFFKTRSCFS